MRVFRRLLLIVALLALMLYGAVLAANNPGSIAIDVGFARFESVPKAFALASAFAAGFGVGLACAAPRLLKLAADRRRLRRRLASPRGRPASRALDDAH